MGACSIQPRKQRSFPSAARLLRNRSRSSLTSTAAASAPSVSDGSSSSSFLSALPQHIRSKVRASLESRVLDLSKCELASLAATIEWGPVLEGLVSLTLSDNGLGDQVFMLLASTSLTVLTLSKNSIDKLPAEFFSRLPNLQSLSLAQNEIAALPDVLPDDAFPRLAFFDLSCNPLSSLPENLHVLQALRTLSLSSNRLVVLPDSLGQLHLTQLDLAANRLTTLPPAIAQNLGASLKTLSLAGNEFAQVPESLLGLTSLVTLDLSFNRLEALPELESLAALRTLSLQKNAFSLFPATLCQLGATAIDLSSNHLSAIDAPELVDLSGCLLTLNLQKNRISQLGPSFFQLTTLSALDLSSNRLTAEAVAPLAQLSFLGALNLSRNPVSSVLDLERMEFLATLHLSHSRFVELPPALCVNASMFMKILDLSCSRVQTVPDEIGSLAQLEELNLSHNQITTLPDSMSSLKNLVKANFAFNTITSLPAEFGSGLQALEILLLNSNELVSLPSTFSAMSSLKFLSLTSNSLPSATKIDPLVRNSTAHRSNSDCDQHQHLSPKSNGAAATDNPTAAITLLTEAHRSNSDAACESFWSCLAPLGRSLLQLHVARNELEHVPEVLSQLTELRHLDLSFNRLASIAPTDIQPLSKLSTLVLSNNQLVALPAELASLTELALVVADNNHITTLPVLNNLTQCSLIANPLGSAGDPNSTQFVISPIALAASSSDDTELACSLEPVGFSGMTGLRHRMEDSVFVHAYTKNEILIGLFDGHGGSVPSHLAAHGLHREFSELLSKHRSPPSVVESTDEFIVSEEQAYEGGDGTNPELLAHDPMARVLLQTCAALDDRIISAGVAGGTTALLAYRNEQFLYVANVGDSRAVLCRGGVALPLSVDHSPFLLREKNRLMAMPGGFVSLGRVRGSLAVSRAFGDRNVRPWVSAIPDITRVQIAPEDQFLLMACDGFWDVFSNEDGIALAIRLLNSETPASPARTALALRDAAFARGSTDNITVCVLHLS